MKEKDIEKLHKTFDETADKMECNEKLMCLDCEYFTLIDIEQAEAYPWCDAHNKRVLPTDYCQYFKQNTEE